MKTVYFDNAATTPIRTEVLEVVTNSMKHIYGNPSASYAIGRQSKSVIESARKQIATNVGVEASEIIFTSGGTESNNLILQSAVKDLGITHIITSKIEHHAVLKVVEALVEKYSIKVSYLPILKGGEVCLDTLTSLLLSSKEKVLVSLMHINNEIGTILNIEKVGKLCEENEALFHTDTVQSIGHYPLDITKYRIHFATASAHKFYGPKGVGFAVIRKNSGIRALMLGGEQERGIRAGTEATHQIAGMEQALQLCCANMTEEAAYVLDIKKYTIKRLKKEVPSITFNAFSDEDTRNFNLLNICMPIPSDKANSILFKLDMLGIYCSRGSACQSGSNKPSHVLVEFLSPEKLANTSLRFSFSIYNTKKQVDYLIECLNKLLAE